MYLTIVDNQLIMDDIYMYVLTMDDIYIYINW